MFLISREAMSQSSLGMYCQLFLQTDEISEEKAGWCLEIRHMGMEGEGEATVEGQRLRET
jgi:hypothetical protein